MNPQEENIERVRSRLTRLVIDFCKDSDEFYMDELRRYVALRLSAPIAPDSPGRILRDLRQAGVINYQVVNRRQSLYQVLELAS